MMSSGAPLKAAVESSPFLIKPNRREISQIVDAKFSSTDEFGREVSQVASTNGIHAIVVSAGPDGVVLATEEGFRFFESPTVEVVSKIGAGDSMVAGIVVALINGHSLEHATLYGMAAGASAAMTPGTDLCTLSDTDSLMENLQRRYL